MVPEFSLTDPHFRPFDIHVRRIDDVGFGESVQRPFEIPVFRELLSSEDMQTNESGDILLVCLAVRVGRVCILQFPDGRSIS